MLLVGKSCLCRGIQKLPCLRQCSRCRVRHRKAQRGFAFEEFLHSEVAWVSFEKEKRGLPSVFDGCHGDG